MRALTEERLGANMIREGAGRQPLYVQVAQALSESITDNRFAVGALLPTEQELSEKFGVSRHTVREAIRHLRAQGLLSARRGIGTRVEARQAHTRFTQAHNSLADITRAPGATLAIHKTAEVTADAALAQRMATRAGKVWLHIAGVINDAKGEPLCWTDLYIDRALTDPQESRVDYGALERRYAEMVAEVQQDVRAGVLAKEHAGALKAKAQEPALFVTRRYLGVGGRLVEVAFNCYPAERFSLAMTLKRDL